MIRLAARFGNWIFLMNPFAYVLVGLVLIASCVTMVTLTGVM